ncbi:hypothetical protein DFA_04492 [Cavenderia fasciculata]|uniref:Uncharacterized protein n=1 Tax=Cavenderia fasciculata TaxID=261658 RepID=F4PPR1_CACFS|nr:uncharacterized protein DFA_04492 [Cavenderia fasciculata]EGG22374.1 hypothetical protein DFA_04492 [Cavenderia fasciculata]|eukprot:XP_004360225.1 hypothetical protein DFA_04492 [Cavenderia fasciculata]
MLSRTTVKKTNTTNPTVTTAQAATLSASPNFMYR